MFKSLILLTFASIIQIGYIAADPTLPGVIAATDGDPNVIVAGCVNAITGDLILNQDDLVVRGAVPLPIRRNYVSGNGKGRDAGWHFFFPHFTFKFIEDGPEFPLEAEATTPSGSTTRYHCKRFSKKKQREMYPQVFKHAVGVTNNSSGIISGRTNYKNNRVYFKEGKDSVLEVSLVTGDGLHYDYEPLGYKKGRSSFNFVLVREELPNGCFILYEHDKEGRPTLAKVVNPAKNKVFSWARFTYEGSDKENHNVHIETSDHRNLHYIFERRKAKEDGGYSFYLRKVTSSTQADEQILFAKPPKGFNPLLTEIRRGDALVQKIAYLYPEKKERVHDKDDLRCNRVKELWSPSGPNGEEVCTHRFSYSKFLWDEEKSICEKPGTTTVTGANGYKAEYQWSRELRPLKISLFDTEASSRPIAVHELVWGGETSVEVGDLRARALLDSDGRYLWIKSYEYDDQYNPITETLHGNLTGAFQGPLSIDKWKVKGGETYKHHYSYSNDGRNLLIEDREDNGRITRYQYLPGTSILNCKFIGDAQRIWQREFYQYDGDHLLVAEILDDGSSSNCQDLSNVTTRAIKRTYRRADGLPEKIEERCYDPATCQEKLLKAVCVHYTSTSLISRQDILDSEGSLAYSLIFEYDDKDRLVRQTDPLGYATTMAYDHLGRISRVERPGGSIESICYDAAGRPLSITQGLPAGPVHTARLSYNALSHKIASIDPQGHVTRFFPDPWGRSKRIEYPDGSSESAIYNPMDCPTQQINQSGAVTTTKYNAYGKPIFIRYPNGTEESYLYDPTGNLLKTTNCRGTSKLYSYDLFGRTTHQRVLDSTGQLLLEEFNHYRGPHLTQHINAEEEKTEWEYDAAGRKIAEHRHSTTTRFSYDTLGRPCITSNEEATQEKTYDHRNQVIQEKTIAQSGELHQSVAYTYDASGKVITTTTNTLQGASTEQNEYDIFGRPISHIDPLGHTTTIEWDESIAGAIRKITTDPVGTQIIETIGVMDHTLSKEVISPQGKSLADTTYTYDAEGHCIIEQSALPSRTIVTKREYAIGNLITLIEAAGTSEQKITRYTYSQDLLSTVQKNHGVQIGYTYDALDRIATCRASTGEGYSYSYDRLHRTTSVTDLANGLASFRNYDATGAVSEEVFLHGLSIRYRRDSLGKPLALTLPDQTGIGYRWEAGRLREIHRLDASGSIRYSHAYDQFDLTGRPYLSTMIASLGTETHTHDIAHRPRERSTSYHSQIATRRNPLGSLLETETRFLSLTDAASYSYDPLQQLESELTNFHRHTFSFDAHGTPLLRDGKACQTNHLYQLEGVGGLRCSYTPAGNLANDGRFHYRYDAFDRLIEVEEPGIQKAQYIYDSWHRRMQKVLYTWQKDRWVMASTRSYLYDGMREIGSTDESGNIVELRLLGSTTAEAGATVAIECSGRLYAPLHDLRGNITGLVDAATRQLVEIYRYSAFGETLAYDASNTPPDTPLAASKTGNPWRYFGKRTDDETGLILFGRRYYHPTLGRWITPDPAQNIDHPNLYLFLRANPLNLHDALGLLACPQNVYEPPRPNIYEQGPVGDALNYGVSTAVRPFGYALYYAAYQLPAPYVRDGLLHVGSVLARNKRCNVEHSRLHYIPGNGVRDGKEYVVTNGINTTIENAMESGQSESEQLDGRPVWVVHNASNGAILDILESGLELLGVEMRAGRVARRSYKKIYEEASQYAANGEPSLVLRNHSEGCILAKSAFRALNKTNPEIGRHTALYALGSPVILDRDLVSNVQVRISAYDGVGWIDVLGRLRSHLQDHKHVSILEPVGGCWGIDHAIMGKTYQKQIDQITKQTKKDWGL